MAFKLQFSINLANSCKGFSFLENTSTYADNGTGWGVPDPALADVNTATLSIENLTTRVIYDDLDITPSGTVGNETEFTTEDLEVGGTSIGDVTLPDGQYCFTYTVTMNDDAIYQQQVKKVWLCESCCKIKTKACEIDLDCGCCNDDCADEIWKFLQAYTEMKIIEYSAYCGSSTSINNKIKSLQSLLTTFDCKNC